MGKLVDALHYYSIVLNAKIFVPNYKCYYCIQVHDYLATQIDFNFSFYSF